MFILLFSCKEGVVITKTEREILKCYNYTYMNYNQVIASPNPKNNNIILDYDTKGRIIRRNAGPLRLPPPTGYNYLLSNEVYDDIVYMRNKIVIKRKTKLKDIFIPETKRTITIDDKGRMVRKIVENSFSQKAYVISYQYDFDGKLISAILKSYSSEKSTHYYTFYYTFSNLDSIVIEKYHNDEYLGKTIEVFGNYDKVKNPFRKLIIFKETFNRSLSENNYTSYKKEIYDRENKRISYETRNWSLIYNGNNVETCIY